MSNTITITILDKTFQVNCPPEEQEALLQSARALDENMRDIRRNGHVIGMDRIAVMAALNLTYDLRKANQQISQQQAAQDKLQQIEEKIASALNDLRG